MKTFVAIGVLMILLPAICLAGQAAGDIEIRQKVLGDINGDGKKEIAVETISCGFNTCVTDVKIQSGGITVLSLPGLHSDTVDAYKIVGNQIVVWRGDWKSTESKWKPFYYDFIWYRWDSQKKLYVQSREGFTRKAYSYKQAEKIMPFLAGNPNQQIVLSRDSSFAKDSLALAKKKYHRHFVKAKGGAMEGYPLIGRSYGVESPEWILVTFYRDGRVKVSVIS